MPREANHGPRPHGETVKLNCIPLQHTQQSRQKTEEDLIFFDPVHLFKSVVASNIANTLHIGLGEFHDAHRQDELDVSTGSHGPKRFQTSRVPVVSRAPVRNHAGDRGSVLPEVPVHEKILPTASSRVRPQVQPQVQPHLRYLFCCTWLYRDVDSLTWCCTDRDGQQNYRTVGILPEEIHCVYQHPLQKNATRR